MRILIGHNIGLLPAHTIWNLLTAKISFMWGLSRYGMNRKQLQLIGKLLLPIWEAGRFHPTL